MSGISRVKSAINESLGLNEWGQRIIIPGTMDSEIIETNQEFQGNSISGGKIESLSVSKLRAGSLNVDDYLQSTGFISGLTGWQIKGDGTAEFVGITLSGGTLKYGKTSFTDSANAGYIFDSNGMYVGAAADSSYIKYDIANSTFALKASVLTGGGSIINGTYIDSLSVDKLSAGTITSKTITLAIADGTGDSYIAAGKTDFTNIQSGFILGIDDSDSNLSKFYIGNSTDYFNFDGSYVSFRTTRPDAIVIENGSNILVKAGGNLSFTSVTKAGAPTLELLNVAGNLGDNPFYGYSYLVTFFNADGETSMGTVRKKTQQTGYQQMLITDIDISTSSSVIGRKIYRAKYFVGDIILPGDYKLLTTINDNTTTTYTDNIADPLTINGPFQWNNNNSSAGKIKVDDVVVLSANTSNTFVGEYSGIDCYSGNANVALGSYSFISGDFSSYNCAIGYESLYNLETGYNNIAIGFCAGKYETGSNAFYINSIDRGDTANDKTKSLLYGIMDSDAANQTLVTNSKFTATYGIETTSIKITTGAGNGKVLTSDNDGNATWEVATGGSLDIIQIQIFS